MEKLKQKLSSRKLWAAIIAVIVVLAVILLGEDLTPETVAALECVVGAAMAYIFGEGAVDVARVIAEAVKKAYSAAYEVVEEDNTELQDPVPAANIDDLDTPIPIKDKIYTS